LDTQTGVLVCGVRYNISNFTWIPSSTQCCAVLKWPPLADHRKFCIIQTVHDILHHRICIDLNSYCTVPSTCTRSHSLSLFCKQASIILFDILLWNCVSCSILTVTDHDLFKSRLYSFYVVNSIFMFFLSFVAVFAC